MSRDNITIQHNYSVLCNKIIIDENASPTISDNYTITVNAVDELDDRHGHIGRYSLGFGDRVLNCSQIIEGDSSDDRTNWTDLQRLAFFVETFTPTFEIRDGSIIITNFQEFETYVRDMGYYPYALLILKHNQHNQPCRNARRAPEGEDKLIGIRCARDKLFKRYDSSESNSFSIDRMLIHNISNRDRKGYDYISEKAYERKYLHFGIQLAAFSSRTTDGQITRIYSNFSRNAIRVDYSNNKNYTIVNKFYV